MNQFRIVSFTCCLALFGLTAGCGRSGEVDTVADQDQLEQYLKEHPELADSGEEAVQVQSFEPMEDGGI